MTTTHMNTVYILLLIDIILAALAQLMLKKGMLLLGPIEFSAKNLGVLAVSIFKSWHIPVALVLYGVSLVLWLFVISKISLSSAYPFTALMYVFIIGGAWYMFNEEITINHGIGVALILAGLFFIFRAQ